MRAQQPRVVVSSPFTSSKSLRGALGTSALALGTMEGCLTRGRLPALYAAVCSGDSGVGVHQEVALRVCAVLPRGVDGTALASSSNP